MNEQQFGDPMSMFTRRARCSLSSRSFASGNMSRCSRRMRGGHSSRLSLLRCPNRWSTMSVWSWSGAAA